MHADGIPAKKRKVDVQEKILEVPENKENPLQCPVKFYEFYLSKWLVALLIFLYLFMFPPFSFVKNEKMFGSLAIFISNLFYSTLKSSGAAITVLARI